jgi:multicomponent Na+:H+ antiporter subunit D
MMGMQISSHLPVLQVIVPLLVAPICVIVGNRAVARLVMVVTALVMFAITLLLLEGVLGGAVYYYQLGGWAAPWGIEYRVDQLTVFVLLIINLVHLFASIFCLGRNDSNLGLLGQAGFYAAWLLCMAGLNGMVVTNDAFNVFVFLEISSLSTYVLISCGRDPKALLASYRYLIMGAIGATFILLSIGLLYMQTGTLNISDLSSRIADQGSNRTIIMALAFFIIGIGIKCAIFPLHDWLPNAYSFAPNSVTVLLSGTATKVSLYVLIRFVHDLFGVDYSIADMPLDVVLIAAAIVGMLLAPLIALRESNLKRMFAWSSVAQISYIALGVGLGTQAGVAAALLHMFNHSVIKAAIFMAVGIIISRTGTARIKHLGSVAHHHRFASYAMLFGGLGLIGIPGTVGFISKWVLISAVVDKGWWWLALPILAGSLTSAAYIWRIVEILWAKPADINFDKKPPAIEFSEWFPLIIMTALALWFGLNSSFTLELADLAAASLFIPGGAQ